MMMFVAGTGRQRHRRTHSGNTRKAGKHQNSSGEQGFQYF